MIAEIAAAGLIIARLVRLIVLTPIEFDTAMRLGAVEIKNVRPKGVLAAELEASELPRSQMRPE